MVNLKVMKTKSILSVDNPYYIEYNAIVTWFECDVSQKTLV